MTRLIQSTSLVIALGAILALPHTSFAQDDAPDRPVRGKFRLHTAATVDVLVDGEVRTAEVGGKGVALAGHRRVVVRTGPMTGDADGLSVRIRWDNPLARDGNQFHGRGVAYVRVGDRVVRYRVGVRGHLERTDDGAVIVGHFHGDGPGRLEIDGGFRGTHIPRPADDDGGDGGDGGA